MSRLTAINPAEATSPTKEMFAAIQGKLGMVPNMMRTMALSPAVLEAYLGFSGTLNKTLGPKEREQIALAVAEVNHCEYCASAHSVIGKMVGLTPESILAARRATATDERQAAIIALAVAIAKSRGQVSNAELEAARSAGLSEAVITEVIANVALNVFTNFFNNVAQTTVDFPKAEALTGHGAGCAC